MSNWKAGDIAIIANASCFHEFVGREVQLLRNFKDLEYGDCWEIDIPGAILPKGKIGWCAPTAWLRKRPSDDDQLFTKWARDHLIMEPLVEIARRIHPSIEEINAGGANGR